MAQQRYRTKVRKAAKKSWRTFGNSIDDLTMSVRFHRTLSRYPKIKLGSLVDPFRDANTIWGENLRTTLPTPFPNSAVTEEVAAPAAVCCTK